MNSSIFSVLFSGIMIFAPVSGYIIQYKKFQKRESCEGFNMLVCFILLVANILRCFFWFGKQFDIVLLLQSLVMIVAQLILLEMCVRLRPSTLSLRQKKFSDFKWGEFWDWDDFSSYIVFLLCLVASLTLLTFTLQRWQSPFTEFIGFLSLAVEAILGIPQLYTNQRRRSTTGLSFELIATWFAGDTFKTFYFVRTEAPLQFVFCGIFQLLVDLAIFYQIFSFNH